MESVFDFWRNFCQNGRGKYLKIGTIPPKSGRMVSLYRCTAAPRHTSYFSFGKFETRDVFRAKILFEIERKSELQEFPDAHTRWPSGRSIFFLVL